MVYIKHEIGARTGTAACWSALLAEQLIFWFQTALIIFEASQCHQYTLTIAY